MSTERDISLTSRTPVPTPAVEASQLQRYADTVPQYAQVGGARAAGAALYPDLKLSDPYRALPPAAAPPAIEGMRPEAHIPAEQLGVVAITGPEDVRGEYAVARKRALDGMIAAAEGALMQHGRWDRHPEDRGPAVDNLYNVVTLYDPATGRFTGIEGQQHAYVDGVDGRVLIADRTPTPLGRPLTVEDSKRRRAPNYIPQIVFDSRNGNIDDRYGVVPSDPVAVEEWNTVMARSVPVSPEAVNQYGYIMASSSSVNRDAQLQAFNRQVVARAQAMHTA